MWSVLQPPAEDPDERADRLLAQYERDIEALAKAKPVPFWDGYCGLVKVQDEDYVRAELAPDAASGGEQQHATQQQQQQQPARAPQRRHVRAGSGACTPPGSSASPRSSPGSSPFKLAPGTGADGDLSAGQLAERAAALLQQQGRLGEAEALLQSALRRCLPSDTTLAGRIVDLTLEAERERLETPTHSRQPSGEAVAGAGAIVPEGSAALGAAEALLRQGVAALGRGEQRQAAELLRGAAAACPPDPELRELRRRIELHQVLARVRRQL